MHAMAVKHGGKYIDTFLKGEELWFDKFTMYICLFLQTWCWQHQFLCIFIMMFNNRKCSIYHFRLQPSTY